MKDDWDSGKAIKENWSMIRKRIRPVTDKNE